ncbi:MAG: acyl-CoA thioester hydrolase [Anaerophaga sp.]|uniref:acyl-CoA thioesterase n=1 Tax=Anaerophaga thermohalophila TaxID=177400 RepID=UPI000237BE7A|nr:thioesterase family protein [Anaerophaga thermohalophila]MDK2841739.1 acyl-CoA thioester hydrolase [Anaerophaga sp.]MDN5291589.1 acyl-CoA thioester hydrolase [Anaerophaga sp.]
MLKHTTKIRVRYGETDQMGIVNNAVYSRYFEVGRTELFRNLGLPYSKIEQEGILLPLSELHIKYHHPAVYDEELTIETYVEEFPTARIRFKYNIYNETGKLLVTGETVLAFLNSQTRRPTRIPQYLVDIIKPYFDLQ